MLSMKSVNTVHTKVEQEEAKWEMGCTKEGWRGIIPLLPPTDVISHGSLDRSILARKSNSNPPPPPAPPSGGGGSRGGPPAAS